MATTASDFPQDTTNEAGNGTPDMMDPLRSDAASMGQDEDRTYGRMGNRAREGAERLAGSAKDTAARVGDAANEYAGRARATGQQLLDDARDTITAYPLRSVGIAAAAGYVLMRMLR